MGLIFLIVILILLSGGVRSGWGYGPNGLIGTVLLVLVILILLGHVPFGW